MHERNPSTRRYLIRSSFPALAARDALDSVGAGREAASRSERIVLFHSSPVWLPWEWQSYEHQFVVILFHLQSMPISFEVYF